MPFVKRPFHVEKPIKAFLFIMKQFNFTQGEAQRLIAKGRILIAGESIYYTGEIIEGDIEVVYFEPKSRGVKPIFVDKKLSKYLCYCRCFIYCFRVKLSLCS